MLRFKLLIIFIFTFSLGYSQVPEIVDVSSLSNEDYCPGDSIQFSFDVDADRNLTSLKIVRGMGEYCNKKYAEFIVEKFDSLRRTIPYEDKLATIAGNEDICYCYKGFYMQGKQRYRKRNYAEAIEYFDKSINSNAEYTKSYRYKALCQIKLRNIDAGCISLKKAVDLGDKSAKREYPEFCK